ncbi:15-hydroxyprostaglandin dehydrogenase [NAD(+)]-like isoform X2 [Choristoneura fumiferana]|uniref:15-hydroxyprostaglandin dehydrogenase [NAD(+)]-like isoform X2 n=1 Tax=Choristoneura fumiferana TaxID=7141 RepID=UPI003D157ABE
MSYKWQDKVVLITGAANGIGACVVVLALQEEAKHIAILDIDETIGVAFQEKLNKQHGVGKAKFYRVDVTSDEQLFAAFESVVAEHGGIDVVVNNAGIMNDMSHIYKKEIAINFTAVVGSTMKAIEVMRTDEGGKGGTVINISSVAALQQSSFMPIYYGTKAAVLHFSNCVSMQHDFARTGVRVLTICIGGTATSLSSKNNIGSHDKNITPEKMHRDTIAKVALQNFFTG